MSNRNKKIELFCTCSQKSKRRFGTESWNHSRFKHAVISNVLRETPQTPNTQAKICWGVVNSSSCFCSYTKIWEVEEKIRGLLQAGLAEAEEEEAESEDARWRWLRHRVRGDAGSRQVTWLSGPLARLLLSRRIAWWYPRFGGRTCQEVRQRCHLLNIYFPWCFGIFKNSASHLEPQKNTGEEFFSRGCYI